MRILRFLGKKSLFIWLITALFYSFQFFLRSSPNAMMPLLMKEWDVDQRTFSIFTSTYYAAYGLFQIPVGIALDTWGPKIVLRWGTLLCVCGAFLMSISHNVHMAIVSRTIIGMGAAVSFTGSIRMQTLWIPPSHRAFAVGALSFTGKIAGGTLSTVLLPVLIAYVTHWSTVIVSLSIIGLVLCISCWMWVTNGPEDNFYGSITSFKSVKKSLYAVIKTPYVWAMGFYGYSIHLTLSVFADVHSINFLSESLKIPRTSAGALGSFIMIGSATGAVVLSFLSDFLRKRVLLLQITACMTLVLSSMVFFFTTAFSPIILSCIVYAWGFFSGGQILVYVVAGERVSRSFSGIATGVVGSTLMLGSALHNSLVGFILGRGSGSLGAYHTAFGTLTLCFILTFIMSLMLKESPQDPS